MKSDLNSLKVAATVLRWTARILSLAVIGLLLAFMIGEGFRFWRFTPKELTLSLFFTFAVIIGILLGWRWELLGGLVTIGGLVGFYGVHFLQVGFFPRGHAFLLFALPGFLFVLASVVQRFGGASTAPALNR